MVDGGPAETGPLLIMHIPKTAGTSLRRVAERHYERSQLIGIYPGSTEQIEAFAARGRMPLAVIGHFRFGFHERLPAGGRYVTFLRDPVGQVVSHFNFLAAGEGRDVAGTLRPTDTIEDFLAHPWARNLQTQFATGWSAEEIEAAPDAAFERAVAIFAEHFVGVGLVEHFEASVRRLAPALGWRVRRIPKLNRSPRGARAVRPSDLAPDVARAIDAANACDRRLYEHVRAEMGQPEAAASARPGWRAAAADWISSHLR